MQAWLQEFTWTEAEKLQKWKLRAGNLRLTSAALHELNKEPMFCFESAIKLYYYSHIIYHYDKAWFPALSCLVSVLCMRRYWLLLAVRAWWKPPDSLLQNFHLSIAHSRLVPMQQ